MNFITNKESPTHLVRVAKIVKWCKIYCNSRQQCIELDKELIALGFQTRVGCNEARTWSIYIIEEPKEMRDCLSCSNSFSEPNENGDILHCVIKNDMIVSEEYFCSD